MKVCRTITQGEFSTEECTEDSIGRPPEQDRLFGSLALSLNPLVSSPVLGDLQLGTQFLALLTTTTGAGGTTEIDLFGGKSWAYRVSVPVFLVQSEEPWGVAAGFAPELSSAIGSNEPEELRFLFFVGARSMAAPRE